MPGQTTFAFDDPILTAIAVVILAILVVRGLVVARRRISDPRLYSIAGGAVYAVVYFGWWWAVEMFFGTQIDTWVRWVESYLASVQGVGQAVAQVPWTDLGAFVVIIGGVLAAITLQATVALFVFTRWRLKTPIAVLSLASIAMGFLFGIAGGETPGISLIIWTALGVPCAIAATVAFGAIELKWRRSGGLSGLIDTDATA